MRYSVLILLLLLPLTALADELVVSWQCPTAEPEVVETSLGQYFRIPGSMNTGSPGEPSLPVFPVAVLLPQGAEVESVETLSASRIELAGTYDIKPVQQGVPISRPELYQVTPRNSEAYSRTAGAPLVEISSQGSLLGFNLLNLRVSPLKWDPSTGRAVLCSNVSLRVNYSITHAAAEITRGQEGTRVVHRVLENTVVNPRDITDISAVPARNLPWGEYLIVTCDSLTSYFEPLAQFKTMKGIPARIVTMEYIESNYTGVDAAQKLRFFLRDIYDDNPPTYILLGGDTPQVPHRNCWATAEGYTGDPAADIYYQDMNDTHVGTDLWDANNNGTWGEIDGDVMDYHPDYFIGRASVENGSEAILFVNKVMNYEMPSLNDSRDTDPWFTSMGFTTGVLWSSPYCPGSAGKEKVDSLYTPSEWQPVVKHYQSNGSQSYALTMDMLNMGMHLVNHAGHGSQGSVSIGSGSLGSGDFMDLTNITDHGRVSIWNTIACLSGSFDTGTCLAEAWIRSPEGGGFCMMNTRYGWGEPSEPGDKWSELVDQEFFAKFFTEDLYHLGVAHAMAWDEYIPLIPSDTHYDWIAKSITLFGDPELPMWTQPPDGDLTVDGPDELNVGACNVTVDVFDDSGPLSDARVCFMQGEWDDPEMYEIGYTDASGQVQMDLTVSDQHDTAAMTVWSRNHVLQTVEIPVEGLGINHQQGPAPVPYISAPSPNPAAASVSFQYSSPVGAATLDVYDASGRRIRTIEIESGDSGTLVWNCSDNNGNPVPSGLYFARFTAEGAEPSVKRIVITAYE